MSTTRPLPIDVGERRTTGIWTQAEAEPSAVAVIAHGAGAPMTHPYLEGIVDVMASAGVSCLRFNFLYMEAGRRSPDPPPLLYQRKIPTPLPPA